MNGLTLKDHALVFEGMVWRVVSNTDRIEGRGSREVLGYFFKRSDAINAARGHGVMGTDAEVDQTFTTIIAPTLDETKLPDWERAKVVETMSELHFNWTDPEILRKQALAKLSDDEKRVLGLT